MKIPAGKELPCLFARMARACAVSGVAMLLQRAGYFCCLGGLRRGSWPDPVFFPGRFASSMLSCVGSIVPPALPGSP